MVPKDRIGPYNYIIQSYRVKGIIPRIAGLSKFQMTKISIDHRKVSVVHFYIVSDLYQILYCILGHRHHRHHHKSRSGSIREAESADNVAWAEQNDDQSSKRSHRRHRAPEIASDIDDENNIYDMPKMPPVPVALPPPSRYANEEKGGDKSKRERAVESLYKTVSKASPKSKHVSKSLQTREEDNVEDLYAQVKRYYIFFFIFCRC